MSFILNTPTTHPEREADIILRIHASKIFSDAKRAASLTVSEKETKIEFRKNSCQKCEFSSIY
ncbi:MAG: hypothetical protein AAFQ28_15140, partial [Pseudomonadota bacterium]